MPAPSKTAGTGITLDWQDISTGNVVISATQDVSGKFAVGVSVRFGRKSGTAFTAGWPNFRIEARGKSSGNDSWIPIQVFTPLVGASIANTTLNGAVSAAATSCVVTSATNIAVGDYLFLGDSSASNYELVRVKSVSGTTVNFEEACTNAHSNGATVTDQAESYFAHIDVSAILALRVVADNLNSGQTIAVEAKINTMDSIA